MVQQGSACALQSSLQGKESQLGSSVTAIRWWVTGAFSSVGSGRDRALSSRLVFLKVSCLRSAGGWQWFLSRGAHRPSHSWSSPSLGWLCAIMPLWQCPHPCPARWAATQCLVLAGTTLADEALLRRLRLVDSIVGSKFWTPKWGHAQTGLQFLIAGSLGHADHGMDVCRAKGKAAGLTRCCNCS